MKPAAIGDSRCCADPASCTSPPALENCSASNRSVTEALYAGFWRAVQLELKLTPRNIFQSVRFPLMADTIRKSTAAAEPVSPAIIKNRRSYRSANTPPSGFRRIDGINRHRITIAKLVAELVCRNTYTPRAKAVIPFPKPDINCPDHTIRNLEKDFCALSAV